MKVAMIGAGSVGFTRRLMMDLLAVPEFRRTEFRLMDIDPKALDMVTSLCRHMIESNKLKAKVIPTNSQAKAIRGADYVICMVRVGGLKAFAHDVEIPLKYGVNQAVADTLGPGGVFYALRTIPVLLGIAADMRKGAPNALLLNYSNPMAMNTWAVNDYGGVRMLGLCHGVQGSHWMISNALGLPAEEVDYTAAGLNHQTWFIRVSHKGRDVLPGLYEKMAKTYPGEKCRLDVLKRFGYWSTESSPHLSEYLPWYRKTPAALRTYGNKWPDWWPAGSYLRCCREGQDNYRKMYPKWLSGEAEYIKLGDRSHEHGSYIIEGIETGRRYRGHFNVKNRGMVTNLPDECIVEIPCYVDGNGITPGFVGELPMACAATCRVSTNVQEMAVRAAVTGDRDLVKQAIMHDPLTGAVLTPDKIWQMCDEMFDKLAPWLPQFKKTARKRK